MLRGVVGDSAFHAGIRDYYARHRNGTALTADLRAAMEAASGRELGWFFSVIMAAAERACRALRRSLESGVTQIEEWCRRESRFTQFQVSADTGGYPEAYPRVHLTTGPMESAANSRVSNRDCLASSDKRNRATALRHAAPRSHARDTH